MAPATPRTARLINDRSAYQLLLDRGPLTRTQLRALTGLSRPTVADLIDRLTADRLIVRLGESGADRRGPNAALYGVAPDRAHVAGVAVDTGRITVTRADATGRTVGTADLAIDPNADPTPQVLAALAATGTTPALGAVAVGTPGLVDPASGAVTFAAGLPGWHGDLRAALRDRLGVPVLVDNEVNLAGIAEHRLGAARGADTFGLLSLGSGVGVAVLLGGRVHRGASGGAGEIGYLPYGPVLGRPSGGLQRLIGAPALAALADRWLPGAPPAGAAAADRGDPVDTVLAAVGVPEFRAELAELVAVAVVGVCAVLDPGTVVLGGPIGHAGGTTLAELVAERVAAAIPLPTTVLAGTVTGDPVGRGAVLTALELLHEDLFATPLR